MLAPLSPEEIVFRQLVEGYGLDKLNFADRQQTFVRAANEQKKLLCPRIIESHHATYEAGEDKFPDYVEAACITKGLLTKPPDQSLAAE